MSKIVIPSTDIASFVLNSGRAEIKKAKVSFGLSQSGNGDPSPDNIRPISAITGFTVYNDPVYGGNIDWNQHADAGLTAWNTSRLTVSTTDGITTFRTTSGSSLKFARREFPENHKVLVTASDVELNVSSGMAYVGVYNGATATGYSTRIVLSDGSFARVLNIDDSYTSNRLTIGFGTGAASGNTIVMTNLQIFDLTQMFGVAVANQIFAMEQSKLGSGVEYFRKLFPNEPYAYNLSEISTVSKVNGDWYEEENVLFNSGIGNVYAGDAEIVGGYLVSDYESVDFSEMTWSDLYTGSVNKTVRMQLDAEAVIVHRDSNHYIDGISEQLANKGARSAATTFSDPDSLEVGFYCVAGDNTGTIVNVYAVVPVDYAPAGILVYRTTVVSAYSFSPVALSVTIGQNNVWADIGNIELEYEVEDRVTIKLNGTDMTDYFVPKGIKVGYSKVLGKNGGTFLSGDREEDVLAWKATVTLICMPLNETQQAEVLSKVMVDDPTLYYFDPRTNVYRTIHYMASVAETVYRGKGSNQVDYWTGIVITAEEK